MADSGTGEDVDTIVKAFRDRLVCSKQLLRRHDPQITDYFRTNMHLVFYILDTPELVYALLLSNNTTIEEAFNPYITPFLLQYPAYPAIFYRVISKWACKYPDVLLRSLDRSVISMFIDNMHIEDTSHIFTRIFEQCTGHINRLIRIIIKHSFFTRLISALQPASRDTGSTTEYDYDRISINIIDNKHKHIDRHININRYSTKCGCNDDETEMTTVSRDINGKGALKEIRKLKITKETTTVATNQYSIARTNILTIILTFIREYNDDSVNHMIMTECNTLLDIFIDTCTHPMELNMVFNILKILVNKRNSKILIDMIGRRMNHFRYFFMEGVAGNTNMDSVNINKLFENEYFVDKIEIKYGSSRHADDSRNDKIEIKYGNSSNKHEDDNSNSNNNKYNDNRHNGSSKNDSRHDSKNKNGSTDSKYSDIDSNKYNDNRHTDSRHDNKYTDSNNSSSNKYNDSKYSDRNVSTGDKYRSMLANQLIRLRNTEISLGMLLKIELMSILTKYKRIRETLRKQLIHVYMISLLYDTKNANALHGTVTFLENVIKDYKYMAEIVLSSNILKMIQCIGREEYIRMYGINYARNPAYVFNTYIASMIMKMRKDMAVYYKIDISVLDKITKYSRNKDGRMIVKSNKHGRSSKVELINRLLFKLKYLDTDDWLYIQDGVFNTQIARYTLTYDDRSVHEYMEKDVPESMYRYVFMSMVWDMPFHDMFSETGI